MHLMSMYSPHASSPPRTGGSRMAVAFSVPAAAARLVQRALRPRASPPPPLAPHHRIHRLRLSTTASANPLAARVAALAPGAIWLPLPRLAPNMVSGRIAKWLKREGEAVECYEVIAEVASESLVEDAHKVGRFAGEVTLLLESQEEGYLAKIYEAEDDGAKKRVLRVGAPIAVLCEEEDEVEAVTESLRDVPVAELDLYDPAAQQHLRICNWQAYLKGPPPGLGPSPDDACGCG